MTSFRQLIDAARRLLSTPIQELSRVQLSLRYPIDLVRHCTRQLYQDRASQMAAALTYHTLFSLLPTIVLILVALEAYQGLDEHRVMFRDWVVEKMLPPTSYDSTANLHEDRNQLAKTLQGYMDTLEKVDFRKIGAVGLLVFLYGATTLLTTTERSFNLIFGITRVRPIYLRLPMYYTVITLGPFALTAGQLLQQRLIDLLAQGTTTSWLISILALMLPLITTWSVFLVIYILLPNTRVSWRAAAVGSFVAAILLVVSHELFSAFATRGAITSIYGSLALLPLFLMWLWLMWLIILFGLELTYTLQSLKGKISMEEQANREAMVVGDPLWLVPLMAKIGQSFASSQPISGQDLADHLKLPVRSVLLLGEQLERQGFIHQVKLARTDQSGYALAKPPDQIKISQLLALGHNLTIGKNWQAISGWKTLQHLMNIQQSAADITLEKLLQEEP